MNRKYFAKPDKSPMHGYIPNLPLYLEYDDIVYLCCDHKLKMYAVTLRCLKDNPSIRTNGWNIWIMKGSPLPSQITYKEKKL